MFSPHQTFWQRLSSILMAPAQTSEFPFEVFLPLVLVLPLAAIFQPLVAFVCFVIFAFCYVMQNIATLEEQRPSLSDGALSPANCNNDQYADPIGSLPSRCA